MDNETYEIIDEYELCASRPMLIHAVELKRMRAMQRGEIYWEAKLLERHVLDVFAEPNDTEALARDPSVPSVRRH